MSPVVRLLAVLVSLVTLVSGCSGSDEPKADPTDTLAAAKKTLDETPGLRIGLSTGKLPAGVNGLLTADGIATHAPAFLGDIKVAASGITADAAVVAVDGVVHAKLPFTSTFQVIDPADYGAPDPADLMATEGGLSDLLVNTDNLKAGDTVRGGANNEEVLTEYTGTVPATFVKTVIPSASGDDFDATYTISADGELREAKLTGDFYPDAGENTYTLNFTDYGTEKDITAP